MAAAAGFLEERQVAEGALVLAVDKDFLGVDGADDAGGVGQGLVGEGEAVGREAGEAEAVVEFFVFLDSAADVEGEDEGAALFAVDGSGELLDEVDLGGTDGLEVGGVFADEALEGAGGLDGGEEGVERGVCDGGLGGVGFGAAGFCAIAAGGFALGGGALAFGCGRSSSDISVLAAHKIKGGTRGWNRGPLEVVGLAGEMFFELALLGFRGGRQVGGWGSECSNPALQRQIYRWALLKGNTERSVNPRTHNWPNTFVRARCVNRPSSIGSENRSVGSCGRRRGGSSVVPFSRASGLIRRRRLLVGPSFGIHFQQTNLAC
jgi:hypothetical protein